MKWSAYDPEYEQAIEPYAGCADGISRQHGSTDTQDTPRSVLDEDTDDEDSDGLSASFARIGVRSLETREEMAKKKERQWLISYCVCNDYEPVKTMLHHSANCVEIVGKLCSFTGKSVVHMVCEEGHIDVVNLFATKQRELRSQGL